ncbi:gas vesicle protein [Streptomyces sp. NPDC012637]|uniref:gas vesicle protein n=1 Tax=Streptomyces sp. NPDC012637 TaxID=3364842 RepID=UPI0036EB8032
MAASPMTPYGQSQGANLADILERVLDKGIVIVGDIRINLLDIELLTIRLRLLVASVDKAREIGIDWWEHDPALSSRAEPRRELEEENERLRAEVKALRARSRPRTELPEGTSRRRRAPEPEAERRAAPERRSRRRESEGRRARARADEETDADEDADGETDTDAGTDTAIDTETDEVEDEVDDDVTGDATEDDRD